MGCNKFKINGSEKEFNLEELKKHFAEVVGKSIETEVEYKGLMLIPDFVTRLKVEFGQELKDKLGINGGNYNYNEILAIIKANVTTDLSPDEYLRNILDENIVGVMSIYIPNVEFSYNKQFLGYDLSKVPSDVMIEAKQLDEDGNIKETLVGPKSYIENAINKDYDYEYNVITKTITDARPLKSYDYAIEKDGKLQSIKDTKEYLTLWEFANKRPKSNGKFSDEMVAFYLSYNGFSEEDIVMLVDAHRNSPIIDVELRTNIISFLKTYNISEKENVSGTKKEASINKAHYVKEVNDKEFRFKEFFRSKLIARITSDGYKHIPSEAIGPLPNLEVLGIDMDDSMETIENDPEYFNRRLNETNYVENVPLYKGFLDLEVFTHTDLELVIDELLDKDGIYNEWPWFKGIQNDLTLLYNSFADFEIDEKQLDFKVKEVIANAKEAMYKDLSSKRRKSYEQSKLLITSRIPSQAKQSTSFSKLTAIVNSRHAGLYESHENFIIKGQDNDGDKLNTLFVQLDRHGIIIDYNEFTNQEGVVEGYNPNVISDYVASVNNAVFNAKIDTLLLVKKPDVVMDYDNIPKMVAEYGNNVVGRIAYDDFKSDFESNDPAVREAAISKFTSFSFFKRLNINPKFDKDIKDVKNSFLSSDKEAKASDKVKEKINTILTEDEKEELLQLKAIPANDKDFKDARKRIKELNQKVTKETKHIIKRYKSAMINYIIKEQMAMHADPKIAIEKEIAVASVVIESIVDGENVSELAKTNTGDVNSFSGYKKRMHNANVNGYTAAEYVIHQGDTQVAPVANFIRVSNMFKELASQLTGENRKLFDLKNPVDMSYYTPIYIDGKITYKKKTIILSKPLAFDEIAKEEILDAGDNYNNIHNTNSDINSFISDISSFSQSVNDAGKAEQNLADLIKEKGLSKETVDFLNNADKMNKNDFIHFLYKQQIWEDLSEIMTGAVDNAKLLVLTRLGINTTNMKHSLTLLIYGVSIQDMIAIIRQGDIVKALNDTYREANNNKASIPSLTKKLEGVAEERAKTNNRKLSLIKKITDKKNNVSAFSLAREYVLSTKDQYLNILSLDNVDSITNSIKNNDESLPISSKRIAKEDFNEVLNTINSAVIFVENTSSPLNSDAEKILSSVKNVFLVTKKGEMFKYNDGKFSDVTKATSEFFLSGNVFTLNNESSYPVLPKNLTASTQDYLYNTLTEDEEELSDYLIKKANYINTMIKNSEGSVTTKEEEFLTKFTDYDFTHNPAEAFLKLDGLVKEINVLFADMSFKNGKNNSPVDMKNYLIRIENAVNKIFANAGVKDYEFDLFKFAQDKAYRLDVVTDYEGVKLGINPLSMILQIEDLRNYIKVLVDQEMIIRHTEKITKSIDALHKKVFINSPVSSMEYRVLSQSINNFMVQNFLTSKYNSLKTLNYKDKKYDLTTKQGQHDFVIEFPSIIEDYQHNKSYLYGNDNSNPGESQKYKDNFLLKNIVKNGQSKEEYGPNVEFLGLPRGIFNEEGAMAVLKDSADKLKANNATLYNALYIYDLLITGGVFSKNNISNILGDELSVKFDKSLKDNQGLFNDVDNIDLDYFLLLNPILLKNLNKDVSTKVSIDRYGVIKMKITIDGKPISVPLVKEKIRQTGNVVIRQDDKNTNQYDIIEKAGYKYGFDVNVMVGSENAIGSLLGFDGKEYVVLINGMIKTFNKEIMSKWNKDFVFKGYSFGPKKLFKDVLERDYDVKIASNEKTAISLGKVRYKILGEETELEYYSEKFKVGDIIKKVNIGNSVYAVTFRGIRDANAEDTIFSRFLDKKSSSALLDQESAIKGRRYAYASYDVIKSVTNKVNTNTISKSKLASAKILTHLTAKTDTRNTHLWTTVANAKSMKMMSEGSVGQVVTKDRVFALKTKSVSPHWIGAAIKLGIYDPNNIETSKKILKSYMGLKQEYIDKNTQLHNFFNAEANDQVLIDNPLVIIEAIPMNKYGANNTYVEAKLMREREGFASNLSETVISDSNIIYSVESNTISNYLGASTEKSSNIEIDADTVIELENDTDVLMGASGNSNAKMMDYNNNSFKNDASSSYNAIMNSDVIVIETSSLTYSNSEDVIGRIKGIIPSKTSFSSFESVARKNNITTPVEMVEKIKYVVELLEKQNKGEKLTFYEKNELENYNTISFTDSQEMIDDIVNYYSLDGASEGIVGKNQRVFANGQKAFVSFQLAKNIAERENKVIYVYSSLNETWQEYNQATGSLKNLTSIPRVSNKKIAYLGSSDKGLDLMLKVSSYDKEREMDPGFMFNHDYIVDDNADEQMKEKSNINPVTLELTSDVKRLDYDIIDNKIVYNLDGQIIKNSDINNLEGFLLNKYSDGLMTLESNESDDVYIINMSDEQRETYDNIGDAIDNNIIKFNFILGEKTTTHVFEFGKVYSVNKRIFAKRGSTNGENIKLDKQREAIREFTNKRVDVAEGVAMSMKGMVAHIKATINKNTEIGEDNWYNDISTYVDFIVRLKKGVFNEYLDEQSFVVKDILIKMDEALTDIKKEYRDEVAKVSKKYSIDDIEIQSNNIEGEELLGYSRVFFKHLGVTPENTIKANANKININEADSNGYYRDTQATDLEGNSIPDRDSAYGLKVSVDHNFTNTIYKMFNDASNGNKLYVEFNDVRDENNNFRELFTGVSYDTIAKSFAKVIRSSKKAQRLIAEGKVVFNNEAAELINSTDGNYSLSDINNNKVYRLIDTPSANSFNAGWILDFNNMSLRDGTKLMDKWNKKLGLIGNTNKYAKPSPDSELSGKSNDDIQAELTNLLIGYFNDSPKEFTLFLSKLKGRNFYNIRKGKYSVERAMADIINDKNSISFLFDTKIEKIPERLNGKAFQVLTHKELADSGFKFFTEGTSAVLSNDGTVNKVKIESLIKNIETDGEINPALSNYGINLSKEEFEMLTEMGNDNYYIVSLSEFDSNLDITEERVNIERFNESDIDPNVNLNDDKVKDATIVYLPNIKQSVLTKKGTEKSRAVSKWSEVFGNVIVTNMDNTDTVFIKSPYYGDLDSSNKSDFYDAFKKFQPVLDRVIMAEADIALSGGVTFNEYSKAYILNKGYKYDATTRTYTKSEVSDIDGIDIFKSSDSNFFSVINNNEKGRSNMPAIFHTNEDDARAYRPDNGKYEIQRFTHINFNSIFNHNDIVPKDKVKNILGVFKPSNFSTKQGIDETRNILERRATLFVKLAVAVDMFKDSINFDSDIDKATKQLSDFLLQNDDARLAYETKVSDIITDNMFNDNVSSIMRVSMILDFNAINIFLKEYAGVDVNTLKSENKSFNELSEIFRYDKIVEQKKAYKTLLKETDFNFTDDIKTLELFSFMNAIDPNASFDDFGNVDFGATMHIFVENGINGIKLANGSLSLFESMNVFNVGSNEIELDKSEGSTKKLNNEASSLFFALNKFDNTAGIINAINKTSKKNIPFHVDGDIINFYSYDGTIQHIDKKTNIFEFVRQLRLNVLNQTLKSVGMDNMHNMRLVYEGFSGHIKFNIEGAIKTKGFDEINPNDILFSSFKTIYDFNPSDFKLGAIYNYENKTGIVLQNENGNEVLLLSDGKILDINDNMAEQGDVILEEDIKIKDTYAKPASGTYSNISYLDVNEYKSYSGTITVDSSLEASDDKGNTYKYNYNLNTWEIVSSETSNITNKVSGSFKNVPVGILSETELDKAKTLLTDNGMIIKLRSEKEFVGGNDKHIRTYDIDSEGNKINEAEYKLNRSVWVQTSSDTYKFRSKIESITLKGNKVESQRVNATSLNIIVNHFSKLYPNKDITVMNSENISEDYGKEFSDRSAFIYGDKVIFNSDIMTVDAPVHELGHLYLAHIKEANPELYIDIIQKAFDNEELMNDVKRKGNFNSALDIAEEVIVIMMGYNSQGRMNNLIEDKSIWQSIIDFFNEFINSMFGTKVTEVTELSTSLNDIIDTLTDDVLYNENSIFKQLGYNERQNLKISKKDNKELLIKKLISLGKIKVKPVESKLNISSRKLYC